MFTVFQGNIPSQVVSRDMQVKGLSKCFRMFIKFIFHLLYRVNIDDEINSERFQGKPLSEQI